MKREPISFSQGYKDYPSYDLTYQYDSDYERGYCQAYHDNQDAIEERRLEERDHPRAAEMDRRRGR